MIRTYHPSLSRLEQVYLVEESEQRRIWVSSPNLDETTPISTHAGGLEIHLMPGRFTERITTVWPRFQFDPIGTIINPRKFLSRDHLHRLREMFPTSIGVRLFISGFVVVLFKSHAEIESSWRHDGFASTFGTLRLYYDVLEDTPSQRVVLKGAAITATPASTEAYVTLGLKLRFPAGEEAITVPTHAFVALQEARRAPLLRLAHWYHHIKVKLARLSLVKSGLALPAIGSARQQQMENSPIGKRVFLAGHLQQVSMPYYYL
jgi:hypothetical protein